jgi:hypothetical protein
MSQGDFTVDRAIKIHIGSGQVRHKITAFGIAPQTNEVSLPSVIPCGFLLCFIGQKRQMLTDFLAQLHNKLEGMHMLKTSASVPMRVILRPLLFLESLQPSAMRITQAGCALCSIVQQRQRPGHLR